MLNSEQYEKGTTLSIQRNTLIKLAEVFYESEITNLITDNFYFEGVGGTYFGKTIYCIHFMFEYNDFYFEFYLQYDQLEFYISKGDKIKKSCNYEDFTTEEELVELFISTLIKDMRKLKIPIK